MKFGLLRNLAAKLTLAFSLFAGFGVNVAHAGIPVIDAGNLTQNIVQALQTVSMYAQQIQQYQTQLQQYETEIKNSVAPAAYLWDQAQSTINKITGLVNQVENLRNSNGALDAYLNNFQNAGFYSNSPCFKATGCSGSDWNQLAQKSITGSQTSKSANDALLRSLDQQQAQLQSDAANLSQMQTAATTAVGQMSAIQSANQLASATNNNLLQIRALLIAQQQAVAAKRAADLDKDAQTSAAESNARSGTFKASSGQTWDVAQ
jgi:P-type conjugative transfer protein TrbJ